MDEGPSPRGGSNTRPSSGGPDPFARSVRSLAKGTTIGLVGTLSFYLFTFVSRVVVARTYTQTHWGEFNIGVSLVGLLSTISLLGFQQALARELSFESDPEEQRAIVGGTILVAIALGAITSATMYLDAGFFASLFHDPGLVPVFELLSLSVGFNIVAAVLASIHQGFQNVLPNAVFVLIANPALFVGVLLISLFANSGFNGLVLAYTVSWMITTLALGAYTIVRLPRHLPGFSWPRRLPRSRFWHLAVSLWGVNSLAYVTAYFDTLYLAAHYPAATVGLYSAAMTLARVFLLANGITTFIFLPVVAGLHRDGQFDTIRRVFVALNRWVVTVTLPLFFLFALDPSLSIRAVFGRSFVDASLPLGVLSAGVFLAVAVGPVNATLAGLGAGRMLLLTTGVSAALNLTLSIALIPTYGAVGAAVAWSVARAAYPLSGALVLYRQHEITVWRSTFYRPRAGAPAVGVPIFAAANLVFLPYWTVVPLYFLGAAVFLGAILGTRAVDQGDLLLVSGIERALGRPIPWLRRLLNSARA